LELGKKKNVGAIITTAPTTLLTNPMKNLIIAILFPMWCRNAIELDRALHKAMYSRSYLDGLQHRVHAQFRQSVTYSYAEYLTNFQEILQW
jgi:hypothetical protein